MEVYFNAFLTLVPTEGKPVRNLHGAPKSDHARSGIEAQLSSLKKVIFLTELLCIILLFLFLFLTSLRLLLCMAKNRRQLFDSLHVETLRNV